MFPASNPWNRRVDRLPVARNSAAIIRSIGVDTGLHPDFGSGLWDGGPIGIPITVVERRRRRKSRVRFDYADESDKGPYPIPAAVKIEGGAKSDGDRHALIVDRSACRLYELYALRHGAHRLDRRLGRDLEPAARTGCGPRAGRRPTPRACRSCPASPATTRSRAA